MFIKCLYKYSFFVDELSAALDKIEEQKGQVVIQRSDDDIQKIADQVNTLDFLTPNPFIIINVSSVVEF